MVAAESRSRGQKAEPWGGVEYDFAQKYACLAQRAERVVTNHRVYVCNYTS